MYRDKKHDHDFVNKLEGVAVICIECLSAHLSFMDLHSHILPFSSLSKPKKLCIQIANIMVPKFSVVRRVECLQVEPFQA